MGDPKKFRKKYDTPAHPWSKAAIESEAILRKDFGLKKKKEIYIASSFLKKYKDISKRLIADKTAQGAKEGQQMIEKLQRLGLLSAGATLDQVLSLKLEDILGRRIQSIVCRKGLAKSMNQARQFITHRHILTGNKEITSPSYITSLQEEALLSFHGRSALSSSEHPERATLPSAKKSKVKEAEKRVPEMKEKEMKGKTLAAKAGEVPA